MRTENLKRTTRAPVVPLRTVLFQWRVRARSAVEFDEVSVSSFQRYLIHFNRISFGPHSHQLNPLGSFENMSQNPNNKGISPAVTMDEDVTLIVDDSEPVQPTLNIRKESSSPLPLSEPGDVCFSGGLLGPGGTNQYLGKWCNRGQNKGLMGMQGSTTKGGDLIVVEADGRGDKIKVLLSSNHSSQDGKENSSSAKRLKYGAKPSSL